MLAFVVPALRMVSALEPLPSDSYIVSLEIDGLDAFARVGLAGKQICSYGLVFWEWFVITAIDGPQAG
ncbi:MAG: hypothetical protein ACR2PT_03355 [Endozoicomonas sp.]